MARTPPFRQRGAALLVVVTSIAILTAVTLDLAYNTRVSLQTAANARDELRAHGLAMSAVALSRLVLHFQQRLDGATGVQGAALAGVARSLGGAAGGAPTAAAGALAGLTANVRLWELIPVDSSAAALFLGGGGDSQPRVALASASAGPGAEGQRRSFFDFEGSFHADIEDEDRKVNLRQLDGLGARPGAQVLRLAGLVKDPKYDFLFDTDDANGFRVSRKDLFAAIRDWEDVDEVSSSFTGDPVKPFEPGFGDENYLYDRLADRYKAKNAPFDSLDELYLVGGVTDAFMAAFGDQLTVYPDVDAPINVNTSDPQQLLANALMMSDPPGQFQAATLDPGFLQKLAAGLTLARPLPFMAMTASQFATVLQALGVKVGAIYAQAQGSDRRNPFGDRSSTFRIHAVGVAGDVRSTIDAVVTFDRRAEGLAQDQGRLLHWHEE